MKKLLWVAAGVGAVAAVGLAAAAIVNSRRKQLGRPRLMLAGMLGFAPQLELYQDEDIFEAELVDTTVIEIMTLDVSGPLMVDEATQAMLAQLADNALFLK
jgi:hypothetical protein